MNQDKKQTQFPNEEKEETQKKLTPMPKIENYIHPLTIPLLNHIQRKFEIVLNTMIKKFESQKPTLYIKYPEINIISDELNPLFQYESNFNLNDAAIQFNNIIDCIHFFHFVTDENKIDSIKESEKINQEILNTLLSKIKENGSLMLMCDFQYLRQIPNALKISLGENNKMKLFIKLYIIEKLPLITFLYIQKMSESKDIIILENEKMLSYEVYDDLTISKPMGYTISQMPKSISYMFEMYQYQGYLKDLHPGYSIPIKIKEQFWSDNIDFTLTICDSDDEEVRNKKKCVAIIVSKSYSSDFVYLTIEGNMALCKQADAARIILIRAAPFNHDSTEEIKQKLSSYIVLFKFKDCVNESIPVMLMSDENEQMEIIFENDNLIVRDVVENESKNTLRQLIFRSSPTEIQSEVKLTLTSRNNIKNDKENKYIPVFTIDRYFQKGLVQCLDENYLSMFYIKTLLCSIFFLDMEKFPEEKINILILGAGIGTINFYFDKLLKSNVRIDAVELDKNVTEVGREFFKLNNYKEEKNNINWFFSDGKKFVLDSSRKEFYDLIIMDINNTNLIEGISPPPIFFEDIFIKKILSLLKNKGMYIINLMSRSYKNYYDSFNILDKNFPHIFIVDSNEDLNKIHFCLKEKMEKEKFLETYNKNLLKFTDKEHTNIELIREDHVQIIKRLIGTDVVKKNLEAYIPYTG